MSDRTLAEIRADYIRSSGRSISMPIAGAIVWTAAGILGALLPPGKAALALFICTGVTFPLGILVSRFTGENVLGKETELDTLMGLNVLTMNLVWAIAIPFYVVMPASLPLSLGIFPGLLWIIFGWIIQHPIGLFHGIARTVLVLAAWIAFPTQRFTLIPAIVVVMYAITIAVLARRKLPATTSTPTPALAPR